LVIESLEKEIVEKAKQNMRTSRDGISAELTQTKSKKYKGKKMYSP